MSLSDEDIELYARQIILPGVGVSGQERLCASRIVVDGDPEGRAVASGYARAAGLQIQRELVDPTPDCVIIAGAGVTPERLRVLSALRRPIVWYQLDDTTVRAGTWRHGCRCPPVVLDGDAALSARPGLHALAACDAVATAIAVLLGWSNAGAPIYEMRLA
jgi:hypothetical protein